jgi:hypothetical protein
MRPIHLVPALILTILTSVAFAHGVEVTAPDAKTAWAKGSRQKVRWQVAKVEQVHIELIQVATKKRLPVVKNLKNTGDFEWKVTADLEPGQYKILVISTKDEEVHGVSAVFEIR